MAVHGLRNKDVISIVGYQGSGKSTISGLLAEKLATENIEISQVVKAIVGDDVKREDLPATGAFTKDDPSWLGEAVAEVLEDVYETINSELAVIAGVREVEVHTHLKKKGLNLWVFEITADAPTRYARLRKMHKVSSARAFIEHEKKERDLGLEEVIAQSRFTVPTSSKTSPKRVTKAIVKILAEHEVIV